MRPIPPSASEQWLPVRRQITQVVFSIRKENDDVAPPIPTLAANAHFEDLYKSDKGGIEWSFVGQHVHVSHDDLINCHPKALEVLGAITALLERRATEEGL